MKALFIAGNKVNLSYVPEHGTEELCGRLVRERCPRCRVTRRFMVVSTKQRSRATCLHCGTHWDEDGGHPCRQELALVAWKGLLRKAWEEFPCWCLLHKLGWPNSHCITRTDRRPFCEDVRDLLMEDDSCKTPTTTTTCAT